MRGIIATSSIAVEAGRGQSPFASMVQRSLSPGIYEMGDVLGAPDFGAFSLSPNGSHLVVSRVEYVRPTSTRRARVVVLPIPEAAGETPKGPAETMVFTGDSDGWSAEFSDDGEAILFLSDYTGEARPWVARERDAVPAPVAQVTRMAVAPKWRPGGARRGIAFLSFATRAEQGQPDPIVWEKTPAAGYRHLYLVDDACSSDAAMQKLTSGPEDVYDFAWSPDGERIAVLAAPAFEMERHLDNELRILDPNGAVLSRLAMPRGLNAFLSWSPSGTHLAYVASGAGGRVGKPDLYTLRLSDGKTQLVSAGAAGWVSRYDWAPGGNAIWFPAAEGVRAALYTSVLDGDSFATARAVYRPDGFISGLAIAKRANKMVLRVEGPRTPPVLLSMDFDENGIGRLSPITARSARKEARIPGDAEVFTARAPDGNPVDAILLRPRRGGAEKRPLCVWLHGGPNEFCALSYQPWWQLFVARGYTVLAPNFRGSGSYAEDRVRANVGDLGGGDADDVIACLDALALHRHVDLGRIVLFGWSYGAHLAFHVAKKLGERSLRAGGAHTAAVPDATAVKRIVAGGGVYDWLSHYGQAELRFPWRDYLGQSPLLDATEADARSPIRHARALGTILSGCEVVLCAGQNDGRASPMQSRMMHRALTEAGGRSQLILYPGEAHILVEPLHIRDLLDRATAPLAT